MERAGAVAADRGVQREPQVEHQPHRGDVPAVGRVRDGPMVVAGELREQARVVRQVAVSLGSVGPHTPAEEAVDGRGVVACAVGPQQLDNLGSPVPHRQPGRRPAVLAAGVRIRTPLQQQRDRLQAALELDRGVNRADQRLGRIRLAQRLRRQRLCRIDPGPQRQADSLGVVDADRRRQRIGALDPGTVIEQQPQADVITQERRVTQRPGVSGSAPASDGGLELRPAGEPVLAGDDELGRGQGERCAGRERATQAVERVRIALAGGVT